MMCIIELRNSWVGEPAGIFICNSKNQAKELIKNNGFKCFNNQYTKRINGVLYFATIIPEFAIGFSGAIELLEKTDAE